jgi:hypothetical protein
MGNRYEVSGGVTKHTDLTGKEVNGVIDHADGSVTDAKLLSGVGLNDGQIAKLPVASQGQVLTRGASAWVAQAPSGGGFNSRVRAYLSANQSIPTGVDTKVQFNTEVFDGNNEYDPTTNYRFTADSGGYYLIIVHIVLATASSGNTFINKLFKNGSLAHWNNFYSPGAANIGVDLSVIDYLSAGDYIEVYVRQNTGSNYNIAGTNGYSELYIHRLS